MNDAQLDDQKVFLNTNPLTLVVSVNIYFLSSLIRLNIVLRNSAIGFDLKKNSFVTRLKYIERPTYDSDSKPYESSSKL